MIARRLATGILALLLVSCSGPADPAEPDGGGAPDRGVALDRPRPDVAPSGVLRVAAVQYSSWDYVLAPDCFDNVCGLSYYIRQAASRGARLVVTPEYVQNQKTPEPAPAVGDRPGTDARWKDAPITRGLALLATELRLTLVFNVLLQDGSGAYNAALAVDETGKVVARHYKLELFGRDVGTVSAGTSVATSFFDTPAGKAGLLVCADIQCIVTGLIPGPSCSQSAASLLKDHFARQPKLVLFSALWTVGASNPTWAAMTVQKKVATEAKAWLVGANTNKGEGRGGGIWKPDGTAVQTLSDLTPGIAIADIPL